jgi:hypothetical protein
VAPWRSVSRVTVRTPAKEAAMAPVAPAPADAIASPTATVREARHIIAGVG